MLQVNNNAFNVIVVVWVFVVFVVVSIWFSIVLFVIVVMLLVCNTTGQD